MKKNAATADDDISVKEYEMDLEANLEQLVERLKQKRYRAKLNKRRYIPTPNGKQRPLGIPALEDKIVQKAAAMILTAIYEQVIEYEKKWLDRRSQRKSYTWEKYKRVLEYTKIPKPRPTEKRRLHQCALR